MAGTLRAEVTLAAANGLYLVLLLLGGMIVPLAELPGALRAVAEVLPAAALADAMRGTLTAHGSVEARSWLVLVGVGPGRAARRSPALPLGLSRLHPNPRRQGTKLALSRRGFGLGLAGPGGMVSSSACTCSHVSTSLGDDAPARLFLGCLVAVDQRKNSTTISAHR